MQKKIIYQVERKRVDILNDGLAFSDANVSIVTRILMMIRKSNTYEKKVSKFSPVDKSSTI